ncbi:MAG: hypothetical protein V1826_01375 [bacterium]
MLNKQYQSSPLHLHLIALILGGYLLLVGVIYYHEHINLALVEPSVAATEIANINTVMLPSASANEYAQSLVDDPSNFQNSSSVDTGDLLPAAAWAQQNRPPEFLMGF